MRLIVLYYDIFTLKHTRYFFLLLFILIIKHYCINQDIIIYYRYI
jgi:hypothetical protein